MKNTVKILKEKGKQSSIFEEKLKKYHVQVRLCVSLKIEVINFDDVIVCFGFIMHTTRKKLNNFFYGIDFEIKKKKFLKTNA